MYIFTFYGIYNIFANVHVRMHVRQKVACVLDLVIKYNILYFFRFLGTIVSNISSILKPNFPNRSFWKALFTGPLVNNQIIYGFTSQLANQNARKLIWYAKFILSSVNFTR
jgi:hypothetical protein